MDSLQSVAPGPSASAEDLLKLLRQLREAAGSPSLDVIAGRVRPNRGRATSKGYLSQIFRGERTPSADRAEAIACALGAEGGTRDQARWLADRAADENAPGWAAMPSAAPMWWTRSAYIEQVRDFAPAGGLRDRADELAELHRFCDRDQTYLWWQAGPWAGKSALLATFVLEPPPNRDVICFFVTARLATQADAAACVEALVDQLSALLGEREPAPPAGPARDGHWRKLLRTAAGRAERQGRRLVLVVDGLDEDRGVRPGSGLSSVAALLPAEPMPGLRVVVASRPSPELPDDVPTHHPLRLCRPHHLTVSPYARDLGRLARQELHEQLASDGAGRGVLGLLTASGGGLTVADLAELSGHPPYELEPLLAGVLGRTVGVRSGREAGALLFAHETLAVEAVQRFGAARDTYRQRIHDWAQSYQDRGWPAGTPYYLLHGYESMLAATPDLTRLVELVTDEARHDRLLDVTGGDAFAVAEVTAAQAALAGRSGDELLPLVRVAARRDDLAAQNEDLPAKLLAVWVGLGQPARAEALARGGASSEGRGASLHNLVAALIEAGEHERAERIALGIDFPDWRRSAIILLAERAVELDDRDWATRLLATGAVAQEDLCEGSRGRILARYATVHHAIGDVATAAALLEAAVADAERVAGWEEASYRDVSDVAETLVGMGHADRAEQMVRDFLQPNEASLGYAALSAVAFASEQRDLADRMIGLAVATARALADPYERGTALAASARAVVARPDPAWARRLLDEALRVAAEVDGELHEHDWLLLDLIKLAGQLGAVETAVEIADQVLGEEHESAWVEVARAWAVAGRLDLAEEIVLSLSHPYTRAGALAAMAASVLPGAPADAERLALQSEHITRAESYGRWTLLGALAAAAAPLGGEELAGAVIGRITSARLRVSAWIKVSARMMEVGGWAQAQQTAVLAEAALSAVKDRWDREKEAADLVATVLAAGELTWAERLARTLDEPQWRVKTLCAVAAAVGRGPAAAVIVEEADIAAGTIYGQDAREGAFVDVAGGYAHAGEQDKAWSVLARIGDKIYRDRAMFSIAEAAVAVGDYGTAEEVTQMIVDEYVRDDSVAMTAEHLARTGDRESAAGLLRQLADDSCRARVIMVLGVAAAEQADWATADRYLTEVDETCRSEVVVALAATAARAGDTARARNYLRRILPDTKLAVCLPAIAANEPTAVLWLARRITGATSGYGGLGSTDSRSKSDRQ
ncbi:hypothetical protein [Dactylosporangium sp. NPDC006015]|uniref:hypothetical protein n=1 Tax=Dactylosporangium sp. NPDC006015 TaxID=3154576 RepID=UPI0033B47A69